MSRGKRYDDEPKLNVKKVIAVIIAIAVIIMFIVGIKTLLTNNTSKTTKEVSSYYTVYTNGKWGVMDQTGKIIIEPEYDEMITIPNPKVDIFIALQNVDYETNTYKTEILNEEGQELFADYDLVEVIENQDKLGNLWYEDGVLKVNKDGKYGLINYSGKEILPIEYDKIESLKGTKNSIIITKEEKKGLCDNEGNIIIKPEYKEIKSIDDDYKNGYIVINTEGKYGVIDFTKSQVLEEKYDNIKETTSNGLYIVKEGSILKVVNKEGTVLEDKFSDAKKINGENIIFIKNKQNGVINKDGEIKIAAEYDDLQYAFGEYYIAKKSGKYGIINLEKEEKLPFEYETIFYNKEASFIEAKKSNVEVTEIYNTEFEKKIEGIIIEINSSKSYIRAKVEDEYKYYSFTLEEKASKDILTSNTLFLSKKDGKYGYVNKQGNVVVDYIYEDATEQNDSGYVAVKKDGKWGSLNKDGKVIVEPTYDLDKNSQIDFIDKWHIGEDIGLYYYTDK